MRPCYMFYVKLMTRLAASQPELHQLNEQPPMSQGTSVS